MTPDGSVEIDISMDDTNLKKQLKGVKANLDASMKATAKVANAALAGIAAGFAGVAAASSKFAATTDRIDKLSQSIGLSRTVFQELDYTFAQNGASIDSLSMGMKNLLEKADSNSDAFKKLGVSVRNSDGSLRSQDAILKDTIRAFEGLADGQNKALLAQELFGRSAQELMPTLNQAVGSMDNLSGRAHNLGLVLSDEAVDAGVAFGDTMDDLKKTLDAMMNTAIAPLIPMMTDVANKFVTWATEGGRLAGIMKTVGETIKNAWGAGVIQAIIAGVVAIKAATVALGILNAITSANHIVVIISGIILAIGALVAASILIYKNWDKVSTFFQITLEKIKSGFIILGSKISEALTIGFNSAKLALYTFTNAIYQKLFTALLGLIDIVAKLDFAGVFTKQIDSARKEVNKWSTTLEVAIEATKEESAAAIKSAKEEQDAAESSARANVAAIEAEAIARGLSDDAAKEEAQAVVAAEGEKSSAIISLTDEQIAEQKALKDIATETAKQMSAASNKTRDGLMTEIEERETIINLYQQQIDALYLMGATSDGSDEKSKMLRTYIVSMKQLKALMPSAKTVVEKGLGKISFSFTDFFAEIKTKFGDGFGKVAKIISAAFSVMKSVVSKGVSALSAIAEFDPAVMLASLSEMLNGLTNFFVVDIGLAPIWFKTALDVITAFLNGFKNNLPAIQETATNVIGSLAQMLSERGPKIASAAIDILTALAMAIVENLPEIITAALAIGAAIFKGLLLALPQILIGIAQMLPDIVQAIIEVIPLLVIAIIDALPQIIEAYATLLPQLIFLFNNIGLLIAIELIKNMPAIIQSICLAIKRIFTETLPNVFNSLVATFKQYGWNIIQGLIDGILDAGKNIWSGIVSVFNFIIDGVKDLFGIHSPSTVFNSMGGDIIQGLINGITSSGSTIWDSVSGIFSGLWENIQNIFSGAFDLGKDIIGGITSGLQSAGGTISSAVTGIVKDPVGSATTVLGGLRAIASSAGSRISGAASAVGQTASNVGSNISSGVSSVIDSIKWWDVGTPEVSADHMAVVHKGERIVPTTFNQDLMAGNTLMLAPSALSNIISSMSQSSGAMRSAMNLKLEIPLYMDSREVGRAAFEQMDFMAGGAYGY